MAPLVETRAAVSQLPITPYGYTCLTLQRHVPNGTRVVRSKTTTRGGGHPGVELTPGAEVRLRNRWRGFLHRQGDHGSVHRDHPEGAWVERLPPKAGPLYQHRSWHHVALPARRSLRDRRRSRDRPRSRPL